MTKKEYGKSLKHYPSALTVDEVAEILRVSTKTVYKLISSQAICAVKVGRAYRIAKSIIVDYLRKRDKAASKTKCVISDNSSSPGWISQKSCDIVRVANRKSDEKGESIYGKIKKEPGCKRAS